MLIIRIVRYALLPLLAFLPVIAATVNVNPGAGLQAAMDSANNGDTVQLFSGSYTSSNAFQINKSITLQGVTGTVLLVPSNASAGMNINASNAAVQNVTITGGAFGLSVLSVSNVNLGTLTINPTSNAGGHGLNISGSSNITATGITIGQLTGSGSNGMNITGSNSLTVSNCTIQSSPRGIYVLNSSGTVIQNCSITTTTYEGVLTNGSQNVTVSTGSITSGTDGVNVTNSPGATIYNNSITAGNNGVLVDHSDSALVSSNTITQANTQNGVWLNTSNKGFIEKNTITRAALNGIILGAGSNNNIVVGNLVQRTDTQHGVAVQLSDFNTIVDNTMTNVGAVSIGDGVLVSGGRLNRIERNSITAFSNDGIVVSPYDVPSGANYHPSTGSYVAENVVTGSSTTRTGIWIDDGSDGAYVFGNTQSVAAEGGITNFNSSSMVVKANSVSQNQEAGIFIWNTDHAFANPADNVIQNNYVFNNPSNGEILLRGASLTDIAYNYLSVANAGLSAGISLVSDAASSSGPSTLSQVYRNIVSKTNFMNYISSDVTGTVFFQNRYFFSGSSFNFTPSGADIKWDANVSIGGNYWSNFTGGTGNPSRGASYTSFINGLDSHLAGYTDRFPYANEDLGLNHSVTVFQPAAGAVWALGSVKTISWRTQGCVLVDLSYSGGASGSIVQNYPDVGYYVWTVPAGLAAGGNYAIGVSCKNSAGAPLGASGSSAAFTVASSGLLLMTPGPDQIANNNPASCPSCSQVPLRVSWSKSAAVGGVDVFLQTADGGSLSQLASNQAGDFVDVSLPLVTSSRAKIIIRATGSPAIQDSNDGYMTIRGSTPTITNPASSTTFIVGSVVDIEWVSPQGSQYVDLELFDTDTQQFRTTYANIRDYVLNLPDRSRFTYFVPERWMTGAYFRLTFKDGNGNTITQINTPPINFFFTTAIGSLIPLYRLYSPVTLEHLLTTDANEYAFWGAHGWNRESDVYPPDRILNGNYTLQGVNAVPFYRVYFSPTLQHLWTVGRNEYFTLREIGGYSSDGPIGQVFPSQVTGTTALYRLSHKVLPIHLWTDGLFEYTDLAANGWTAEGAAAYLFCAPGDTQHPGCQSTLPIQSFSSAPRAPQVTGIPLENATFAWLQAVRNRPSFLPPYLIHVSNNASMQETGFVASGEVVSLAGLRLGVGQPVQHQIVSGKPLPEELGGVHVSFDGTPAPVLYVSQTEVRAIVPRSVTGKDKVTIQMDVDGEAANPFEIKIAPAVPGLYTMTGTGTGQVAALNQDGSLNSESHPAARGSVVSLFITGQGRTEPELGDEELPSLQALPKPVLPVSVTIGDRTAEVAEAQSAPGVPGTIQIGVRVPIDAPAGKTVPVIVMVGDASSQPGTTVVIAEEVNK